MSKSVLLVVMLMLAMPATSNAQSQVFPLTISQTALATTEDATQVPYYVIDIPRVSMPEASRLEEAWIEFYMDVSSTAPEEIGEDVVTLELYRKPALVSGRLDVKTLDASTMKRSVRTGDGRRVRVYVTDFCRQLIATGTTNTQVLAGSIQGGRFGRFETRTVPNSTAGAKAVLHVSYSAIDPTSRGR